MGVDREAYLPEETRTFGVGDVRLVELEKVEEYLPRASGGRFSYGSEARVSVPGQEVFVINVDSYFNGIMSGRTGDGQRVTGGADFFEPCE
jgi:hypothetical protein